MYQVTFITENGIAKTVPGEPGDALLELARRWDVALDAPCTGSGTCGKCRIKLLEGTLESGESHHLSRKEYTDGWRLACRSRVCGDCKVLVPESVAELNIQTADLSRPAEQAAFQSATAAMASRGILPEVTGVCCAIDIGTTTVSAVLAEGERILAKGSCGNAQLRYGADVISRIVESTRPGGRERLRSAIVDKTLTPLLQRLCREANVLPEQVRRVAIAANTTMNHLLLGVDANTIRMEPYVPAFLVKEGLTNRDVGLPLAPDGEVLLSPNVGSYVGGDITAGCMATALWDREELSLFIDLGTNGEIVLGNREFLLCCACSAGPAFEGGGIARGMRAADGAIEHCTLVNGRLTLQVIGGGKPAGICGSGLIDAVAQLFKNGLIDGRGRFIKEDCRVRQDAYGMGRFVLAEPEESADGREIFLSEADIDSFIRAKGAIFSAVMTMLKAVDMTVPERIYIAGGIGSGIDMENAVAVGMLPDVPRERFTYVGNTALAGAWAMAVSRRGAELCRQIAGNMTCLELSDHPGYMEEFVAACFLPHTDRRLFAEKN